MCIQQVSHDTDVQTTDWPINKSFGNPELLRLWKRWNQQESRLGQIATQADKLDDLGIRDHRFFDDFEDGALGELSRTITAIEGVVSLSVRDVLMKLEIWRASVAAGDCDLSSFQPQERISPCHSRT